MDVRHFVLHMLVLTAAASSTSSEGPALAAPPATDTPALGAAKVPVIQRLVFHGWSPDSRWVAYSRWHTPRQVPGRPAVEPHEQRMHRRIRDGRFDGFGKMVGGDVGRFAAERGYRLAPLPFRAQSPHRFEASSDLGTYRLDVDVGRTLGFSLFKDEALVFRHTFDRLYIGFEPELHPSPDGSQAILVFHLDSGWDTDAAIFPMRLRAAPSRGPRR